MNIDAYFVDLFVYFCINPLKSVFIYLLHFLQSNKVYLLNKAK